MDNYSILKELEDFLTYQNVENIKNEFIRLYYEEDQLHNLQEAHIYVGTYSKYNNGSLFGKWLELSDYMDKEDFLVACKELHSDEPDPEFMFQDWENIPEGLIGESWLSENFFALRDTLENETEDTQEAFLVWLNNSNQNIDSEDISGLFSQFEDEYRGAYECEEDFAYQMVEDCYNLPEFAKTYFDYEKFARDLFCCDFWFDDGFVFQRA